MSVPSNLIPTRITQLTADPAPSTDGIMMYVRNGVTYSVRVSDLLGGLGAVGYLDFEMASPPVAQVGRLMWDVTEHGPSIMMEGGNVNLQLGQETVVLVYNTTGSALTDGQVVYCTGAQGQRLTVALALADSDTTSAAIIGVVTEPIANNAQGFITVQGTIHNVNTHGFVDGAVIYLSPTTPGAWTTTKPQAPQHAVMVGYIVKGGSTGGGSIYVHVQNGYELDELHDVRITSVADGNFLQYDNTVPAWVNTATPRLKSYTVATLPAAGTVGRVACVTDATAPTYLGTLTGGGSVKTPVFDNGTAWVAH